MSHANYQQIHERNRRRAFFPISVTLLVPGTTPGFAVLTGAEGDGLVSDTTDAFTASMREQMAIDGVDRVYVPEEHRSAYDDYIRDQLCTLLGDESVPVSERVEAWHDASLTMVRELFDPDMPVEVSRVRMARVKSVLQASTRFFSDPATLKELSRFLDTAFDEYVHGLSTMVLTSCVLGTYDTMDNLLLASCGAGALLHDIGKARFPKEMLGVPPDALNADQKLVLRSHPSVGVSVCSGLPLLQETLQCILFHHEMEDGSGYPSGARGSDIPFYPKVLAMCNMYENLTRPAYGNPVPSFEAMKTIKARGAAFNPDIFKRLVLVLSKAELV